MFFRYLVFLTSLVVGLFVIAIFQIPDSNLHIIACNVGQGDAILIIHKNIQILTDGGPDLKVLRCLGRHIPFWDRQIELLVATHSDSDHTGGLPEVVKRYKVKSLLTTSIDSSTPSHRLLQTQVLGKGIRVINPEDYQSIRLGMIYLDILHPKSKTLSKLSLKNTTSKLAKYNSTTETNSHSIAYKLSFKNYDAFFLGDITQKVSDEVAGDYLVRESEYIKIPHHGSINGLTENLLTAVEPKVAVISVGKENPWGLPSEKILDLLKSYNVKILRTDQLGDVEIITDGEKFWIKKGGVLY